MLEINGYKVYQGTEIRGAEPDSYKFVKVNGEYRFFPTMCSSLSHASVVMDNEKAESAGFIGIGGKVFRLMTDGSMTLKIGPTQDTGKELEEVIGKPLHDPWA
jgi:hypothetical protein